jgi:hypothetical protein
MTTINQEESIPASSVAIVPVKNQHNQHVFSQEAIFTEVDYCGYKVMTAPFLFNTAVELRRDTQNDELLEAGILTKRDKLLGPVRISGVVFLDRSTKEKVVVTFTDHREDDVIKVNDDVYSVSYGMEIHELPPGDPTVRYFEHKVKDCTVMFIVSMHGTVSLRDGLCFIDTDGSFDGVGFDIYGINGEEDGVVHYETDKHKDIREYVRTNFKLLGYNLDVKRTVNSKVDTVKESGHTFKSDIAVTFVKDSDVTEEGLIKSSEQKFKTTPLIPIVTEFNKASCFSLTALQGTTKVDGTVIEKPVLVLNKRFDLLGISRSEELLDSGEIDETDSIDTEVGISSVFLSTSVGIIELSEKDKHGGTPFSPYSYLPGANTLSSRIDSEVGNSRLKCFIENFSAWIKVKDIVKPGELVRNHLDDRWVLLLFTIKVDMYLEAGCLKTEVVDVAFSTKQADLFLTNSDKEILLEKINFAGFYLDAKRINYNRPIRNN